MPYIPTDPVESSNILRIGYDRKTSILRVIFQGVRAYDYPMFPEKEYHDFMAAESKGKFFNARIKPMYAHRTPRPEELEAPPPFWSPVDGGEAERGEDALIGEYARLITSERPDDVGSTITAHAHGIGEHDHERGDEAHIHGQSVAVPPPALPRTASGEVSVPGD